MRKSSVMAALLVAAALPLFAAGPSKQAKVLLKEGQSFVEEHVWYGRLFVFYKHPNGIGVVAAPKGKEEAARVEGRFFDGVFYVALRKERVHKMVSFEKGRLSRVADASETQCLQAGKFISEELRDELEKAYRTRHRNYAAEHVVPNKDEFRVFIFL